MKCIVVYKQHVNGILNILLVEKNVSANVSPSFQTGIANESQQIPGAERGVFGAGKGWITFHFAILSFTGLFSIFPKAPPTPPLQFLKKKNVRNSSCKQKRIK